MKKKMVDIKNLWGIFGVMLVFGTITTGCDFIGETTPTIYTVTFDVDGGSAVSSQSVAQGGKVTEPDAPTKAGYAFAVWYRDAAKTTRWNFETDTVTQNTTLYAKWTAGENTDPKKITITGLNGKSGSVEIDIATSIGDGDMVASGGGTISGSSVTVSLQKQDGSAWTDTGSYYLMISMNDGTYAYTNGQTFEQLGIKSEADIYKVPKYNIQSATSAIAFSQFQKAASESWDEPDDPDELPVTPKSVQEALLDDAKTDQESASSAEFISANYDPDLKYVVLTYKVGTIKNMFLQYLSTVVVAGPGRELTYSEIIGNSETEQVENINTTAINFNGTIWYAGAGAFAGASVFAGLASLTGRGPQAKANAYAVAGATAGKLSFDFESVTTTRYTQTYQQFLIIQNTIKQDMSVYPAGKKYAVAAFADVGIYQIMKYDPQTKIATAIPGKSLWFNVESRPYWDLYEYSKEEELSIPQQLTPFEKVNVDVKEEDLYAGLERSQIIEFFVGNPRVSDWYRTDWKPITLVLSALSDFGYNTLSFEWKTYWAECNNGLDCTAHVVLDCADINLNRGEDWTYYDEEKNPGAGWKWAKWDFSSPIGTVADRPYIRCAYGYYKHEKKNGFLGLIGKDSSYYDLSGTVSVTITAQK
jgi:uncharacterized repeat protein (TIGR02543 family)